MSLTSFNPLDSNKQKGDAAVPHAASDGTQIATTTNQIQLYVPDVDAALQIGEESADLPRFILSGSLSSPISIPALHSDVIPAEPPSSIESALVRPDHTSPQIGSLPSVLRTVRSHITPQVASVVDLPVTASVGAVLEHDQLRDPNSPVSMGLSLYAHRPVLSTLDITEDVLLAVDHQDDQN